MATWGGGSLSFQVQYFAWLTDAQNSKSVASDVPEIFQEVQNSKMDHLTLTAPLSGMVSQAGTHYD